MFRKSLVKKLTNSEEEAETAENMVRPPDVRDVWDGLTAWLPNTAAVCREQLMLHLLCLMFWAIWMKFLFVQAMRLTEKLQQNSPQQDFWKKQNRFWKCFRDGNAISAESENMKICRKTAANI